MSRMSYTHCGKIKEALNSARLSQVSMALLQCSYFPRASEEAFSLVVLVFVSVFKLVTILFKRGERGKYKKTKQKTFTASKQRTGSRSIAVDPQPLRMAKQYLMASSKWGISKSLNLRLNMHVWDKDTDIPDMEREK